MLMRTIRMSHREQQYNSNGSGIVLFKQSNDLHAVHAHC